MDIGRVVAVKAGPQHGSGFLIAPRLVLTSAHVCPERGAVEIWPAGEGRPRPGRVVWRGAPGSRYDAALVELADPAPDVSPAAVRWGRVVTNRPRLPVEAMGFPIWVQRKDTPPALWHPSGTINPGGGYTRDRYVFAVEGTPPEPAATGGSPWAGLSGAAVHRGDLLIGVVAADLAGGAHGHLDVVPAAVLLHNDEFGAALSAFGIDAPAPEPADMVNLAQAEPPTGDSPSALLRARAETVGFRGRAALMDELERWCEGPGGVAVRLLYGPGGQGKTRIGQELAHRLGERRWATLWLRRDSAEPLDVLAESAVPLLVVVDYAETRPEQSAALLEACLRHQTAAPLRVLMLARTAGDWWATLPSANPAGAALLEGAPADPLPPLDDTADALAATYRQAVTDLAGALARSPAQRGPDWPAVARRLLALPPPEGPATALGVQMTALADLLDHAAAAPDPGPVEDRLLVHEQSYWWRLADAMRVVPSLSRATLTDALASMVLFGAATRAEADRVLRLLPTLADQPRDRRNLVRDWIAALYPAGNGRAWGRLEPDRIAERFAGLCLLDDPHLPDPVLAEVSEEQATQLLTVYARAAPSGELTALVLRQPAALTVPAIKVATQVETPEPLVAALEVIAADPAGRPSMEAALPPFSHVLAGVAADVAQRTVEAYRTQAASSNTLAASLNTLANRLGDLGRDEEALTAAREAVDIRRARPDAQLATSLTTLTARLGALGRLEEALVAAREAVEIRRALAEPGDLALSLNNLSIMLGLLGRHEEGLTAIREAVAVYRSDPDAYRPDLAMALNNLSMRLGDLGRFDEGLATIEEAAAAYRILSRTQPDTYLPKLATVLNNVSMRLANLGRYEEGLAASEEAVEIGRSLVVTRPAAILPDLARSLNNLANRLGNLDRHEEGLLAVREAVTIRRALAEARPDAFLPDLASALNNLAVLLGDLGRPEEGLAASREAVVIRRVLAEARPEAFLPRLATALSNLSADLGELGRPEEGRAAAQEAVDIYRALAEGRPDAVRPGLAAALNNLARRLGELGRREEGRAAAQESVDIRTSLDRDRPGVFRSHLARSRQTLAGLE